MARPITGEKLLAATIERVLETRIMRLYMQRTARNIAVLVTKLYSVSFESLLVTDLLAIERAYAKTEITANEAPNSDIRLMYSIAGEVSRARTTAEIRNAPDTSLIYSLIRSWLFWDTVLGRFQGSISKRTDLTR